jgi:pimeloyl-ACP methyl ester carboxylesterase
MTGAGRRPADPTIAEGLRALDAAPTHVLEGIAITRAGRPGFDAPIVVLVHGLGSARSAWAAVWPALLARYHLIALDLPGHGASAPLVDSDSADPAALADRVHAALQEAGVIRPHLMGNSLGGWVGLELAADQRVASLTGLAPAGLRLRPGRPNRWLSLNRRLALVTGAAADPLLTVAAVRRLTLASGSADPAGLDPDLARSAARAMRVSTGYERALDGTTGRRFDRAEQVSVPVTVVFGDDDRILPPPADQQRAAAPAQTRWVVLRRCGHAPMWDAPLECIRLLDDTVAAATRAT